MFLTCWCFRNPVNHQLRLVVYPPIIYKVLYCTSQVVVWDFFHQQYENHPKSLNNIKMMVTINCPIVHLLALLHVILRSNTGLPRAGIPRCLYMTVHCSERTYTRFYPGWCWVLTAYMIISPKRNWRTFLELPCVWVNLFLAVGDVCFWHVKCHWRPNRFWNISQLCKGIRRIMIVSIQVQHSVTNNGWKIPVTSGSR